MLATVIVMTNGLFCFWWCKASICKGNVIFFSTCSASLVSYIDPKARPTLSDVMITLKDVVHDSWCRLYYSNTIFKMFYLKCETLSTGGKKIAAWDWPSSSVRVSICVCLHRCLFYYKPLRHRIWVILNMSVFVCLVRGLFKSLCAFHYASLSIVCAITWSECLCLSSCGCMH